MIKTFKCEDTERLFNDIEVSIFKAVLRIARRKLEILQHYPCNHCVFLLEIGWSNSKAKEEGNSVSELMTSGEFVSSGREETLLMLRL